MNPKIIKEGLMPHKGEKVEVCVSGMRGKTEKFEGVIKEIYPHIFTIETETSTKSFTYAEIQGGEITINFI